MNRLLGCLLLAFVLLLGVALAPLVAQETPSVYVVQKGDTLWQLAGQKLHDPVLWEKIYKQNPFLQGPGRRFEKGGIIYVLIRPNEKLMGLEEFGITQSFTPLEQLGFGTPTPTKVTEVVHKIPSWFWWILGFTALLLATFYLIVRMLTRDPVNSRPAMVHGGVRDETAVLAIQQIAARASGRSLGMSRDPGVYQQFTVLRSTAGRIWGVLSVRYADGRSVPRRLNGDRAYRAEVRFPDGHTETLYMLQGCGNDLKFGGISRYLPGPEFRFEADLVIAPAPVPAQPEPTSAPASTPAPGPVQSEPVSAVAEPDGMVKFELRKATNGQGAMARFSGVDETEDLTCEIQPGVVTLRFRPKQQ